MSAPRIVIIGGGIGGLAASILLAKSGARVDLYEQLPALGGRARQFKAKGFTFDMGPSWYLMPGVFEHFYRLVGEDINEHLELIRLNPAYKVFFENDQQLTITGQLDHDTKSFEMIEAGAGDALRTYVKQAHLSYELALDSFLYTDFSSLKGIVKKDVLRHGPAMIRRALQPLDKYVAQRFRDPRLRQVLEYPTVFLGASPFKAPALYSLMSYLDFEEGVYYPKGGLHKVIESLIKIAEHSGVNLHTSQGVQRIIVRGRRASGVELSDGRQVNADSVISNADLHFTETNLLTHGHQSYPDSYWQKRTNGPSALLLYLGVKGRLPMLEHHNLFFAGKWRENFDAIFRYRTWPEPASLYICKPSATDTSVAPAGHENVFILVPVPARLTSSAEEKARAGHYLAQVAAITGVKDLSSRIVYQHIFGPGDFASTYNAWQGSALGLSHTLRQSAFLRPGVQSKRLGNLYYVGGNTMPGIGLPMCLISAELVYKKLTGQNKGGRLETLGKLL